MKNPFLFCLLLLSAPVVAQSSYVDSIKVFLNNYVQTHEVVKGEDRKALQFYPVDPTCRVLATLTKAGNSQWITFPTSGKITKVFRVYGTLSFVLKGQPLLLNVYQAQDLLLNETFRNYLFLPFTDSTTGKETYEGGRYLDLSTTDIHQGTLILDFNKVYNPYCAYGSGSYNCPIPPKENRLPVAVRAGEKSFARQH